jgi:hypothetical protein
MENINPNFSALLHAALDYEEARSPPRKKLPKLIEEGTIINIHIIFI